jgi:hypothetical protein
MRQTVTGDARVGEQVREGATKARALAPAPSPRNKLSNDFKNGDCWRIWQCKTCGIEVHRRELSVDPPLDHGIAWSEHRCSAREGFRDCGLYIKAGGNLKKVSLQEGERP